MEEAEIKFSAFFIYRYFEEILTNRYTKKKAFQTEDLSYLKSPNFLLDCVYNFI